MMAEPPVQLDAEIFVKKALERGTKAFEAETQSSPVMNNLIVNLFAKLDEMVN